MCDDWGKVTRTQLRNTITLLWTLKEVPGLQQERPLPIDEDATRQLTVEREKNIVDILAFLAARNDDPLQVMAVCVEESPTHDSITIRLAKNIGDCSEVEIGFRSMACILERSARRVNPKENDSTALLREIVRLDASKILSRLRSRHARKSRKTSGKPPLALQLRSAINDPSIKAGQKLAKSALLNIREKAAEFELLHRRVENYTDLNIDSKDIQDLIMKIVGKANSIMEDETLTGALRMSNTLDPSLKAHLPGAIGKLGRYYSASHDLIAAARNQKYSIFHKIIVEQFQISPPPLLLFQGRRQTLQNVMDDLFRSQQPKSTRKSLQSVQAFLGKSYLPKSEAFRLRTCQPIKFWKVHAEVQLLFFYELHPEVPKPRIICSSKSACYLCDLFFHLHGQYHLPRTHGRIYEKWLLPTWVTVSDDGRRDHIAHLVEKLRTTLEEKIRTILMEQRRSYQYPNESVLWPKAHWSASSMGIHSFNMSAAVLQKMPEVATLDVENSLERFKALDLTSRQDDVDAPLIRTVPEPETVRIDPPVSGANHSSLARIYVAAGETVRVFLPQSGEDIWVETPPSCLMLSAPHMAGPESALLPICLVRCEWLHEVDHGQMPGNYWTLDVNDIPPGASIETERGSCSSADELAIAVDQHLISFKFGTISKNEID